MTAPAMFIYVCVPPLLNSCAPLALLQLVVFVRLWGCPGNNLITFWMHTSSLLLLLNYRICMNITQMCFLILLVSECISRYIWNQGTNIMRFFFLVAAQAHNSKLHHQTPELLVEVSFAREPWGHAARIGWIWTRKWGSAGRWEWEGAEIVCWSSKKKEG